jgi:pentatricopeptide repeat protein
MSKREKLPISVSLVHFTFPTFRRLPNFFLHSSASNELTTPLPAFMRNLSLQGVRWHQYGVYRSHINHAFNPCVRFRRPFTTAGPRYEVNDCKPPVKVRYFEQATLGSKERTETDPEAEDRVEQELLKVRIRELEQELEVLKEGVFGPSSPFMKQLSEKDRAVALEALRKYKAEQAKQKDEDEDEERINAEFDDLLRREFEGLATEEEELWDPYKKIEVPPPPPKKSFEVELRVPETYQAYVDKFNKTLRLLRSDSTDAQRQDAWRSYRRCKEAIPSFLEMVPREALTMLWKSQVQNHDSRVARLTRLRVFVDDMLSSGISLTESQWLEYIEILHQSGKTDKAIEIWKARKDFSDDVDDADRYWRLGVQLLTANGEPGDAEDIALAFLAANKLREPRILISVITAWGQASGPEAPKRTWALYLRFKTLIGPDITMEDYDTISVGLLKAGKIHLALAVFKDMMLAGEDSSSDSTSLCKASLGLVGSLQASSINESVVNNVSLSALTILPRKFQNKFFYASWMKKLIGMGEVDSAAAVVELMYERGIRPDPKHLNGILGGWLREGSATARDKAERLGWAMIQERIDQVWSRNRTLALLEMPAKPSVYDAEGGIRIPKYMQRTVPPANIETFSLLLLHYSRRSLKDMVSYLIECLENAQIRPNSYFMNHLLYAELRRQDVRSVWQKYKDLRTTVQPDLETFACLWDSAKLQYYRSKQPFDADFPPARALYGEMMQWFSALTPNGRMSVRSAFSKEVYDQIIRCFCLSLDPHGTLVALYAMKDTFGFSPDAVTVRILMFLVVRLAPSPPSTQNSRRRRIVPSPRSKENLWYVWKLLEVLNERKVMAMTRQGLSTEDLDEEAQKTFQVELMSDLLRVVLQRLSDSSDKIEISIRAAAVEMGVANLGLGPPLDEDL